MQGMLERMDAYVIEETAVPAGAASPGWDDFVGVVAVRNAIEVAGYGIPEVVDPPEDLRGEWDDPYEPRRTFVARDAGRVVAYGSVSWLAADGPEPPEAAWVDVRVLPEYEGRGIGRALADRLEQ